MGKGHALLTLLGIVVLAGVGCSLVTSYDGFGSTGGAAAATCGPRIPPKPTTPTTTDEATFQRAAMKSIYFAPVGNQTLGYDLDENCTKPACSPLQPPAGEVKLGVDNVIGRFIGAFIDPKMDVAFTDVALKAGRFGLVVEMSKWNQQKNDSAVTVSLYNVIGVNVDGTKQASENGTDAYVVDAEEIKTGALAGSTNQDPAAYVTQGMLVARFPRFPLRLVAKTQATAAEGILTVVFLEASFVAKVSAGINGLQLSDAQMVGRIEASEMLRDIARIGYCPAGIADAGAGQQYAANKAALCSILDLTTTKATDGTNKKCSAASVAFGMDFTATSGPLSGGPAMPQLDECPGVMPDTCQ
jgi:hypothetical protein